MNNKHSSNRVMPICYGDKRRQVFGVAAVYTTVLLLCMVALLVPMVHGFGVVQKSADTSPRLLRSWERTTSRCMSSSGGTDVDAGAQDSYRAPDLKGKVAIVTGATRGIGKGIALELGLSGATVYVAGRSSRQTGITGDRALGEGNEDSTVEGTADQVNDLGGIGIPILCDVSKDSDIQRLVQQVQDEQGRLDILVCSAFATPPQLTDASFRDDFWKQGGDMWDACHNVGLRGMYMTACESVPLMIQTSQTQTTRPLICLISSFGGVSYTFNVAYGVGKAATDRLASDMAVQLSKHNIDAISLYPGVVRTEGNVEMERRGEWEAASGGMDLSKGESPRFSGRAVAMLASDPSHVQQNSGKIVVVAEYAKDVGFTDLNGNTPASIRSLQFILPGFVFPQIEKESGSPVPAWIRDNVPDILLPWSVFSGGPPPTVE